MIINAGGRTDLVHFYSPWLLERFKKGFVYVRNPLYPETVTRYDLTPSVVDCVTFCSKNYAPILPRLEEITSKFNTYFFYTITAYSKDIETLVPDIDTSIDTLLKLERLVGKERIAWRYDPVFFTKKYSLSFHEITFSHMAARLSGHVSKCIFSFVQDYKKTKENFPELELPSSEEKDEFAKMISSAAKKYRIPLQTCAVKEDYSELGIKKEGCITLREIARANKVEFKNLKHSGMRSGCLCIKSSDIGSYDSCPAGCRYCYATENFDEAKENHAHHNPASSILLGHIAETDKISFAKQVSFLKEKELQMELFKEIL